MEESINEVIENLSILEKDSAIPKNVKARVKTAIDILLNPEKHISLRIDQSIEALNDICDDPNIQPYIKMQLWSIVSQLESK